MTSHFRWLTGVRINCRALLWGGCVIFLVSALFLIWNYPPKHDQEVIVNAVGMKLVRIPAGEYLRWSPDSELYGDGQDEKPQHRVRITQDFYLGQHEVTQGDWKAVMGTEPRITDSGQGKDYPATGISWDDANEFCRRLSQMDGRTYRLPTEAEWEYAARAGTTTRYSFGDDESQLSQYGGGIETEGYVQVGQKKPNGFGLFDMHGNANEWCSDWYASNEYAKHAGQTVQDPKGPPRPHSPVCR